MSDARDDRLTPGQKRAKDAVRSLPEVSSDPAFRSSLREGFVNGSLRSPWKPDVTRFSAREKLLGLLRGRPWLVPAAGMAVVLILLFRPIPSAQWRLAGVSGEGTVSVDGRPFTPAELAADPTLLRSGHDWQVEGKAQVDLVLDRRLTLQAAAGSRFTPPGRTRWGGPAMRGSVREGEVRFVTGPAFAPQRLLLDAPTARVEVRGTTLAVLCNADSTCVCVFEGRVRMISASGEADSVQAGTRRTLYADRQTPRSEPIRPVESMKLSMLRDRAPDLFRPAP